MIELKNVSKFYNNNGVVTLGLRNINLKLNVGEIVAITGDSGSGKSTLLNVITAVDTYEEGEIYFEGNETSYFNQNDMDMFRKNNVSFIFQNYNIIDSYTVLENVMIPLLLSGKTNEEAKKKAIEIIDKVGLAKRLHHRGTKLSGGEKQRCVIARALASDSKILACDEPTGNLDSKTGEEIIKLIAEVAKDKLVLIVTHNYNQISSIATRKIKVADGEIIEDVYLKEELQAEEKKDFSLEDQKVKKKTYLRLALQNVLSTPKKTIFSIIVFMVISFITLILCLMMLERSYVTNYSPNDAYHLKLKDRVVVYDKNHNPLDKNIIESVDHKEIFYNAFYEEYPIHIFYKEGANSFFEEVKLTYKKLNYTIFSGREPEKEGEYVYVMSENSFIYKEIINENGREINVSIPSGEKMVGKIVGFAQTKEDIGYVSYLQCYSTFDSGFFESLFTQLSIFHYYTYNGKQYQLKNDFFSDEPPYISIPIAYKEEEITFQHLLKNIYDISYDLEIRYEDKYLEPTLCNMRNSNFSPNYDELEIYEAVIYTNSVKEVKDQLEKVGYRVSIPSEKKVKPSAFSLITLYLFLGLTIASLICLYFISYVILARVYASKNKDYGVLRTLGMVKKQLGRIVVLEVISLGIISSILSFVLFLILHYTTDAFSMGNYMNFGIILLYFVLIFIFSYFIARRFNRRLYKFSVNTTIKGEVARND